MPLGIKTESLPAYLLESNFVIFFSIKSQQEKCHRPTIGNKIQLYDIFMLYGFNDTIPHRCMSVPFTVCKGPSTG